MFCIANRSSSDERAGDFKWTDLFDMWKYAESPDEQVVSEVLLL